ncbi:elongation factor 1-gamma [Hetaerina americana]|uniref:elongation factor 1-gamma n=1 Tax=Hetaerina americana TaxID=62018 RepID=UPI003A7F620D
MASGTLFTYPENFRAYKALIAAEYSGAKVKVAQDFVFGQTNKTEAFLKKFPLGKVPAFETADGKCITESNAIAYFVANDQLRGRSDLEKAQVIQWMGFADNDILPASCTWVFPCLGIMQYNKQNTERAKEDIRKALGALNSHLLYVTYLVGERITLADISVCCTLLHLYQYILDPGFRKPYQNVNRWFSTIINQPQVKAVIGDFTLCEKMAEFDAKKFAEMQGKMKKDTGKDKKSNKKEKPDKPQEKQAETPKNAAEELDETELALAEEPKSKDPMDALPKGTFDLEDFKRYYSNEDEAKSIPYFWEKFDKENWSIWHCEYKYPEELAKIFMSCNLIAGFYQRLGKLAKNAFASMCVFGQDNDNSISGVWVWRGHDLAFELSPDWKVDYDSYHWKKLDANSEETAKIVQQYFSWTGNDKSGKKFNQGKIFK